MPHLEPLALTPRSATVLIRPDQSLFRLPQPLHWQLRGAKGQGRVTGQTTTVAVFLDGLTPDTDYEFTCDGLVARFTTPTCAGLVDITTFGASPDTPDNAEAFAAAVAAVPAGGAVFVPPGQFRTGPVFLKSDMVLHLAHGAVIAAISDRTNWPILAPHDDTGRVIGTWEGLPEASFAAPLTAIGCTNLTLTGSGTIDGGGDRGDWWAWPKETREGARRPRTLFLAHSRDVVLSGLRICNSPSWTVHPYRCDGLLAAGLTIENPPDSPNTDGFNPESCRNTRLAGLRISVGDDCIAVKAGKRAPGQTDHLAPTEGLEISNCLMEHGHGAVVLGSEMSGSITDVTIRNCEFLGTDRGLRIKTRRGRGGQVARVTLDHVVMDGVATPLAVNAFYFCDPDGKSDWVQSRAAAGVDDTTPTITGITLRDVTATRVQHAAIALLGLPEAPIDGIRVERFSVTFDANAVPGEPLMACHIPPVRHAGILTQFANLTCDAGTALTRKDFPHAE